jgi:hypothetical protein
VHTWSQTGQFDGFLPKPVRVRRIGSDQSKSDMWLCNFYKQTRAFFGGRKTILKLNCWDGYLN